LSHCVSIVDGDVDLTDILALLAHWSGDGVSDCFENIGDPCTGDLNADGFVDLDDLLQLLGAWGPCDDGGGGDVPDSVSDCLNRFDAGTLELEKCLEAVESDGS